MRDTEPSEITRLRPATGTTQNFRRLDINSPGRSLKDKSVYDMDFEVDASELPCGLVRFRAQSVSRLTTPGGLADTTSLWIEIRCCLLAKNKSEADHPLNKRWQMELQTDFATKLAVIGERRLIPITCEWCETDIVGAAYVCQKCINCGCCAQCGEEKTFTGLHLIETGPDHVFERVDVCGE